MSRQPDIDMITDQQLDDIVTIQIAVARLGEKPFRHWWNGDIADTDGGADLLQRLVGIEMVPLAVMEGLLLTARRTEERLLAKIPAPHAYSLFILEPGVRRMVRGRIRHFKRYPEDVPEPVVALLSGEPTVNDLIATVEKRVLISAVDAVSEEQTRFGIQLSMPTGADHGVGIVAALARVAIRSPRGEYILPYYREAPRG